MGRTRSAGLPASVTVTGTPRPLPREVDQAAYRIVQEALTNVTRHAAQASAAVHLCYGPDALTVQVDDDGTAAPQTAASQAAAPQSAAPGLGLIGMRERVSSLGGLLQAGPRQGGGFRVWAELPLRASS
jgi:signal transduction histidine kinase